MELTDIHNRRRDIDVVAKRCREHGYPLLAWPQDTELLRLADLPNPAQINVPMDWTDCQYNVALFIKGNEELRKFIKPGNAYAINGAVQQINGASFVVEYNVVTR